MRLSKTTNDTISFLSYLARSQDAVVSIDDVKSNCKPSTGCGSYQKGTVMPLPHSPWPSASLARSALIRGTALSVDVLDCTEH